MRPLHPFGPWLRLDSVLDWLGVADREAAAHVVGAGLIYVALQASVSARGVLSQPLLVKLGEASFGIYLLHIPFLYTVTWRVEEVLDGTMGPAGTTVAAFAVTMIGVPLISYFAFRPIDHVAISLGSRLFPPVVPSRRTTPVPAAT